MKKLLFIPVIILLFNVGAFAQKLVAAKDAGKHVGKKVTICDKVYDEDIKKTVVVFFLGGDRPNELLRVVIRFTDPKKDKGYFDTSFKGKDICVTGVVLNDKEGPYIKVSEPSQIKPFMVDAPVKQPIKTN